MNSGAFWVPARVRAFAWLGLVVALCAPPAAASAGDDAEPARPAADANVIEGRYIVVYRPSVTKVGAETAERERKLGFSSEYRYREALEGFSAELTPGDVRRLERDPEVDFVSEDRRVHALDSVPLASGEPTPPTGIRRIRSATATSAREASGVNVAVIDTGIQLDHPDLNAVNGKNCKTGVPAGTPASDVNGHGTHVAGTIAAKNNGAGVVGVAPGTTVYAVKVLEGPLGGNASGSISEVACGIDWVTANASSLGIRVANMSLGGIGNPIASCAATTDAMHVAICNSTAGGVNYVVAAGNSGWDFDHPLLPDVPAAFPQVLTVTAVADSDGEPGGTGGPPGCSSGQADDQQATFSNFAATPAGQAHTIAAPGVCIRSTYPGGGYNTISGTSMATPHVAGLVALCINEDGVNGPCAGKTSAEVIAHVRAKAESHTAANPGYGFLRDPLHSPVAGRYYGFLAGITSADSTPPDTVIDFGSAAEGVAIPDSTPTFTFVSTEAGSSFECRVDSAPFGPCSGPGASHTTDPLSDGPHSFQVRASDPAGNPDPTPAGRGFAVDTTPPDTLIDSGPPALTNNATPAFAFSATEPGSTFQCKVDDGPFGPCSGPGPSHTTGPLSDGPHSFQVQGADQLGNTDASPAERSFTVDTTPPQTTIIGAPKRVTTPHNAARVEFAFRSSEPGVTSECRLDIRPWKPCTSPDRFEVDASRNPAWHVFKVRSTDQAGNPEPKRARWTFRVVRRR